MPDAATIERAYAIAKERYAELGVDTEHALKCLATIPISLHCWQGDDVVGFENTGAAIGGGLAVTGNYPGKARNADELRADLDHAFSLIPGRHRLNLHASYSETGGKVVGRDALAPEHFTRWIDWAKRSQLGLDFNPTYFAHPMAADGWTLAARDPAVRAFWIEHGKVCRRIGEAFGAVSARLASRTSGFPTAQKTRRSIAKGHANSLSSRSTPSSPNRSTRDTIATRSKPNSSGSAPRATSSARMNFTWVTRFPDEKFSVSTPVTFTRPK